MKNNTSLFLFLIGLFISNFSIAQSQSDVFNSSTPITWLGVDFSEMKFIGPASGWGSESTKSPAEMRDTYFMVWNEFIQKEAKAFKVEEAVHRESVDWAIDVTRRINEKTNKKEIFSESNSEYQNITEDGVKKMIKNYDFKGKTGIGFVLIAEGMNKNLEEASYWATFIDMSSKKVLFAQRITGKAGGFGFRNYWAATMKNVFKTMKKEFKNWE